jgi:hypothetical protein
MIKTNTIVNFVMHILHKVTLSFISLWTRTKQLIVTLQSVIVIICMIKYCDSYSCAIFAIHCVAN